QMTNEMQRDSLSSSPTNMSPVSFTNLTSSPRLGTVTPNSIFVGGIDFKTDENELRDFFAQYGSVKDVKIVRDRTGVSKRYGFINFETHEEAQKILQETKILNYKNKKLNIAPAVRKQRIRSPRMFFCTPGAGTMYLTTSSGHPYIYQNGVAYFHSPEAVSVPQPWTCHAVSSSPVIVAQPVYQSPMYHYQAPTQCLPTQLQWSVPQPSPSSSPSFLYLQPSEVVCQPVGITQEGACVSPLLVEAGVPELYSDHGVEAPHHQLYVPSPIAVPAPV
ncbi:BOLL protein, partial [Ceuthmochares aereus]|nr:BOLL protein [Ceuthmochares aereus]